MIYLTIEFDGLIHQNYKHGATYWPNPLWVASKIQLLLFHWTMSVLCKSSVGTVLIGASARGEVVPILCHLWKLQICRPSPPWPFWQIRSGDKLQWRDIPSGNLTQLLKMTIYIYIYIVDLPIVKWWFSIVMLVDQRVNKALSSPRWKV